MVWCSLRRRRHVLAAQARIHALALDAAPDAAQLRLGRGVELPHRVDAAGAQAALHVSADAHEIGELQPQQARRHVGVLQHHQPVGLLHVRGDLGEKPVGRDADGAGEARAGLAGDRRLDAARARHRLLARRERRGEFAEHLVDRQDIDHVQARLDDLDEPAVVLDVERGARLDDGDAGAQPPRLVHPRAHLARRAAGHRSWPRCSTRSRPGPGRRPPAGRAAPGAPAARRRRRTS